MPAITIDIPDWLGEVVDADRTYRTVEERMGVAVELARQNVLRDLAGPFGAAVFEAESGRLVSVGVNRVVPGRNSILHAEVMALLAAHAARASYTLDAPELPAHDLATSCDPCAMCLGAALWSGVRRLLCGATREDALELGFDEGPVFPASYDYLVDRGIEVVHGILRDDAREVLELYAERGGPIYNA